MNKTILNDRTLWFDGDSAFAIDELTRLIQNGYVEERTFVDKMTPDVKLYNSLVPPNKHIHVKETTRPLDFSWNIPEEYKNIDLNEYIVLQLSKNRRELTDEEYELRQLRVSMELDLYIKLDLTSVLRSIIYIINTLESKKVVWGVGRGSSVSSYILYLIGVHDVDSVLYELDVSDFLRDK